jgi:hypothetical protein
MGLLVAFAAGCFLGARAVREDLGDIKRSLQAVRSSDEFHDLVAALRTHAGQTLRHVADGLERTGTPGDDDMTPEDLVARVRHLMGRPD